MLLHSFTAFAGHRRIASGSLQAVALAIKHAAKQDAASPLWVFDDETGRPLDIDTRGTDEEVAARFAAGEEPPLETAAARDSSPPAAGEPRGRGRPKLGVVAREVTLLPRHWEWLASQPGGASVALRKLVDEARRTYADKDRQRRSQERAYHFMSAMAGDLPGFEEAVRALFANDAARLHALVQAWPADVRDHALALAMASDRSDAPAT
ncbi:DUF2239 family protein [Trinickia caryophylli]|uniref:DUF2239 domain-containing protein n=1 Tax=Trinickia caryophylli TaxID=28094 RepID=A0A1X7GJH8_TRICW|nr:DUF2239 family protein [Trinickia caryophylli]PMS09922.1 DUF2239 domain-containing protein [Trinickia caryophylli]TRX15448.1 DUF2239 family protein [Trinickia caryophylli]WQE15637.1 DUF2239 family protein [Trinickia caryophylli]SMF70745.1 hypothetical protein SAMN06295900_116100 [Trinickia caryophylli]